MSRASHPNRWRDILIALLLATLLTLAWALRDWPALSALRLPDTDDAMRLQQIRDWLGGQPFADLAQHRLGPAGLEMHWSRIPDLVPAAIVAVLTPAVGAHSAELTAVILWPAMLFAAALALTGAIADALGSRGPTAMVVAALAYPATTVFLPGRIDHHGLQLVLVLVLARALLGRGSLATGIAAGIASGASLAIGLETAPLLAVGGAAAGLLWVLGSPGAHRRLLGYGVSLALSLGLAALALRTSGWGYPACDGFTAQLWSAAQIAALAPLLLAILGFAPVAARAPARALLALAVGGAALVAALMASPGCLSPYGEVDPLLARVWLANVAEAQPLFAAPAASAIGYSGLALVGLAACAWMLWRSRTAGWAVLFAFQLAAALVMLFELRGAYAAALLGAPALAALIDAARARGSLAMAGAWLASAGLIYPLIGGAFAPKVEGAAAAVPACTSPAALARTAALPPGTLIAPVDLGAFALVASHDRVIAAPYHRNTEGNRAMYDFFLSPVPRAEALARQWGIDYVALCPDSFDELGAARDRGLAGALERGQVPGWLRPLSRPGEAPMVYALAGRP